MLKYTDRHFRFFVRCITKCSLLYTEMIHANAVLHGSDTVKHGGADHPKVNHLLRYHEFEHPLALQLGGSCPDLLARATEYAAGIGYDEVNLNVGCPSAKVQSGMFGACLMKNPQLVADCFKAMQGSVDIPVTIKTRIGVDDMDSYDHLCRFVDTVMSAGCFSFTMHARKAWLSGLSPKENRTIPKLQYEMVYRLKQDHPQLEIILNGGIKSASDIASHLQYVDGVMIGREAYSNPYSLAPYDSEFFAKTVAVPSRYDVLMHYLPYVRDMLAAGVRLPALLRPMSGLYFGQPNGKNWRRLLTEVVSCFDSALQNGFSADCCAELESRLLSFAITI